MEHIWAVCPAVDGADSLQSGTKIRNRQLKNAPVTAKAETDAEEVEEVIKEAVPEAATDALIVSTTAELISSITPDAHIILKSGTYKFFSIDGGGDRRGWRLCGSGSAKAGRDFCLQCSWIDSGGRKERICAAGYGEWICGCDDSFVLRWCSVEGAGSGT